MCISSFLQFGALFCFLYKWPPKKKKGFKSIPRIQRDRTQVLFLSLLLLLLAGVIITAILLGIYVSQEYSEMIMKTIKKEQDGQTEQTMMVNNQERVAAFLIKTNKTSATVVYDYKHHLIGIRIHDQEQCSVVAMGSIDVPRLNEITLEIEHFDDQVSESDHVVYSFKKGKLAARTALGTTINILCSDIPIYWAEKQEKQSRNFHCINLVSHICLNLL
ncbi:surfactant protein C-like [Erythrolamprus reginae]|uniref:surfactant protein C-like n=1 Tax=Erythrolamprus reginae TaxID=121349 RepID=UPI00396C6D27